jgi:hypothetical protein
VSCFHCRDQQAVPWCTGRRVVARGSLGVVTGAENRDLVLDARCGKRDVDRSKRNGARARGAWSSREDGVRTGRLDSNMGVDSKRKEPKEGFQKHGQNGQR